jgi:hypothetical protein
LRFNGADEADWKVELLWLAVTDQSPSDNVGNVQLAEVEVTCASVSVHVLISEVGVDRVAVTVSDAPAVNPVRSKVGVLSDV